MWERNDGSKAAIRGNRIEVVFNGVRQIIALSNQSRVNNKKLGETLFSMGFRKVA